MKAVFWDHVIPPAEVLAIAGREILAFAGRELLRAVAFVASLL